MQMQGVFLCLCVCVNKSHLEVQFIGPGANDSILSSRSVGDLVLVDIISSWGVSVLIKNHRCAGTSWNKDVRKMYLTRSFNVRVLQFDL